MAFLESTYSTAADLGGWDRKLLNVQRAYLAGRGRCDQRSRDYA